MSGTSWSPDSKKLAIAFQDRIVIVDNNAQLLEEIPIVRQNRVSLLWTRRGIIALFKDGDDVEDVGTLWFSENGKLHSFKEILKEDRFTILAGMSPDMRLLLQIYRTDNGEKGIPFGVLDLESGQVIKRFIQPESLTEVYPDLGAFAMKDRDKDEGYHVFQFDWEELELVDIGPAGFLVGRPKNMDGYLIINEQNGKYVFDVLKPVK